MNPEPLEVRTLRGSAVEPYAAELARLRIEVFREFPYLYDGDLGYEEKYIRTYAQSKDSIFVLAVAHGAVVGASTGLPLLEADEEFQKPIRDSELDEASVFYFGESVLRREYRGRGLGNTFFDARESFARQLGFPITAFCAVERPPDHPRRPPEYRPLDRFWRKRGYEKRPDLVAHFEWKDLDEEDESPKPLVFWMKQWVK